MPTSMPVASLGATLALAGILAASPALAEPVTVTLNVGFQTKYDYASQSYQPFTASGQVALTFENTLSDIHDYGTTTIANYFGGTRFTSPFTAGLVADPYGSGPAAAFQYTFPNVSDYASTFIEEFAAQGNTYSPSGSLFYTYHIETRITRRSPSRGGTGTNDYAFSPSSNISFLRDAMIDPANYQIEFDEFAYIFDRSTGKYLAGSDISDYNVQIRSVVASIAPVPEPPSAALLAAGLMGLAGVYGSARARRRRLGTKVA